jgi:hypothetical protein
MKKLAIAATALSMMAGAAFAGGYSEPVVEPEPVVVEEAASSSNAAWIIPGLLLLGVIAAASSDS